MPTKLNMIGLFVSDLAVNVGGKKNVDREYERIVAADRDDIQTFLTSSPSLAGVAPEVFSEEHQHLPHVASRPAPASTQELLNAREYYKHERYFPHDGACVAPSCARS